MDASNPAISMCETVFEGTMAKYDPLFVYLKTNRQQTVKLTFAQLQSIVGLMPPESRRDKAWWASSKFRPTPQAKSWTDAGYEVTGIFLGDFIVFEKVTAKDEPEADPQPS
jgi:hypothetical protein